MRFRLALSVVALTGSLLTPAAHGATLPSFQSVRATHQPSDLTLLDRQGQVLHTARRDMTVRRLPWVALSDISPAMRTAIVLSEDQRFWQHSGVDWQAVAGSAWANLWNQRTRGASTVTMQLAGLLSEAPSSGASRRNWSQKVSQAWHAGQLERQWRKSDILEAYLNLVPFRGETVGLAAMSQTLFRKHPSGLDAQEAAIAAALVRGPNARADVVARRACQVLTLQQRPCTGIELLTSVALGQKGSAMLGEQLAPHLARLAIQQTPAGTMQVPTTLDARWQRLARDLLRQHLSELSHQGVEDGAVIVLDNASGEVLAWVGGSGDLSQAAHVDAVLARRQPGSTLKPFVYALTFERRILTPASLLHDSPVQLATGAGLYIPQNYDRRFRGWVSVRTALGNSLNVPAVRAGAMLGPDVLAQRLNDLGLDLREPGGYYGPGLALGSAEVTLRDLSNAYRALANGGVWSPLRWHATPVSRPAPAELPHRVMPVDVAYLVSDILADNTARSLTFGLDSVLATRGFAAVKTGTSKDMRDNWCVGYTSRYTVGVWVGNASGSPMRNVSGVSGAAPIWASLVRELHRAQPSVAPLQPASVIRLPITFEASVPIGDALSSGVVDAPRQEVFLAGTQQPVWSLGQGRAGQGAERAIQSPAHGSIFAIDPDMPPRVQRIALRTAQTGVQWWLNGNRLGPATLTQWQPWPGRHVLSLRNKQGQVIDEVRFEVRGAGVKAGAKR
ncbi:penicillin-binding protein 1C [Aquabacterium sp.]|uniref:penicillin-binding protein 1C n=1 Tax=Aquabacterium sp. TaxID=1872578 RepID=UPI0027BAD7C2|nr:penicillin-binding protein 1C [Aquabacterium sp.]